MDFVVELLELTEFNLVITVVDLMSKKVYLTYITIMTEDAVRLFLYYV